MRVLKSKDIFQKTYSIIDGKVIKKDNGDFYTKQVAEYFLKKELTDYKDIKKLDEEQLDLYSVKYFRDNYSILLSLNGNNINLLFQPNKKFEIFTLDVFGGKICLADVSELPAGDNRDLYYSFEIANQVYQKSIDIKDSTFNDYGEVKYVCEKEISRVKDEISDLNRKDNEEFEKDMNAYILISQTPLYKNYQSLIRDKERLTEKNQILNKKISDYNDTIRNLSQKLMISLERVELLQKPKSFMEKVRDLFKNDKNHFLIINLKGEK